MMDIKEALSKRASHMDSLLSSYAPGKGEQNSLLAEAMNYSISAGGKRIRPVIMIETAALFCEDPECIEDFAVAIEMIHTYSLVHDDLPDMDNDLLRRGKASTHAVYGPAQAILAGDALLNLAYEIMARSCLKSGSLKAVRAMNIISNAAGYKGMVGGQSRDVIFDKTDQVPDINDLNYIYEKKCGELIRASFTAGAVLAGAGESHIDACSRMGQYIGVAFQIIDDILDIQGDEKLLGKPVGSDEKNNKLTLAALMGPERALEQARELTVNAMEILMALPGDTGFLKELFTYLVKRDS